MADNKTGGDPVSFTDTNAETGMTGKGGTSSNMMDLVGQLKKQREEEEKGKKKDGGDESSKQSGKGDKKKKKGKKGKKGKSKYVRRHDRYESENYLLRIEGTICCAAIASIGFFVLYNAIALLIVLIWSGGSPAHLHNLQPLSENADDEKKDEKKSDAKKTATTAKP